MTEAVTFNHNTPRLQLALLHAAQAQKEITHNEALMRLDILVGSNVEAIVNDPAALDPDEGQCWIVGDSPTGAWAGKAKALACATSSGWVFVNPITGMRTYGIDQASDYMFDGTGWIAASAIESPSGGSVVDVEMRAAFEALLADLQGRGLLAAT